MDDKPIDLILVNGFTPRRRSPGDVFLDNGMGLLRAFLKKEKINFIIEDRIGIEGYREFDLPEVSVPLRRLLDACIYELGNRTYWRRAVDSWRLRSLFATLHRHQEVKMKAYLAQLRDRVVALRPAVVGMKVWFGSTFAYCNQLCELIGKASPETILVAGGPHANCYHVDGMILKHSMFDLAIYSEGESALTQVVRVARKFPTKKERMIALREAAIANVILRDDDGILANPPLAIPIDDKVVPDYDEHELSNKVRSHTIIDALGCDYGRCSFCVHPKIHPQFRMRDPVLIVDEIECMLGRGIGFFTFTASNTPLAHACRISEEILKRKLTIEFTMLMRGAKDAASRKEKLIESFRTIIRAGLRILYMGVEAGNDDVLREVFNKNLTVQEIENTVDCIRKASELEKQKVFLIASFIYPVPLTDTLLDRGIDLDQVLEDDIRLAKRIAPDSFQVMPAIVYPGVKWYSDAEKYNIEIDRKEYARSMLLLETSPHLLSTRPHKEPYRINGQGSKAWVEHYLKICRRANKEGLATELNDEHIVIGISLGYETREELQRLSRELFLDILSGHDETSRHYFRQVNARSQKIADANRAILGSSR